MVTTSICLEYVSKVSSGHEQLQCMVTTGNSKRRDCF